MLEKLIGKNLVLLENVDIGFSDGLNIATGETGAGKSLILNTLVCFPLKKFPNELIHDRNKDTKITIKIRLDNKNLNDLLAKEGILKTEENALEIIRDINSKSISKFYINGIKVKPQLISILFDSYFSFFVQGAQSLLMDKKFQLQLLDKYLRLDKLCTSFKDSFAQFYSIKKTYLDLVKQKEQIDEKRDLFEFQLSELDKIKITSLEQELELIESQKKEKEIRENRNLIEEIVQTIADRGISFAIDLNRKISRTTLGNDEIQKLTDDLVFNMKELSYEFSKLSSECEVINQNQGLNEDDLFILRELKRKYQLSTDELVEKKQEIKNLLSGQESLNDRISSCYIDYKDAEKKSSQIALKLSAERKKGSIKLVKLIKRGLKDLGIPNSTWIIGTREKEMDYSGIDDVEFMFSANPDFSPEPLKSVASGGELSRIMLVLALEISKVFESKIILFDEPDVGLGGAVAEKLGEKISALSQSCQVLCISHLPQVASFANNHFLISKRLEGGKTSISIKKLSREGRVLEIARMLSGKNIENEALILADKMIK